MKKVIVTCGPGFERIDDVRRLTNMSTGQLGVLLAERLASRNLEVICYKGSGATWPHPQGGVDVQTFDTNDDLLELFKKAAKENHISAIFHVAALCDYKVKSINNEAGQSVKSEKIPTNAGSIILELEPSLKVLPLLRPMFPSAMIVGWKYELSGSRNEALARARNQIETAGTDACVVNGKAFGPGFGYCVPGEPILESNSKTELVEFLAGFFPSEITLRKTISSIRNFVQISDRHLTGGMPGAEHFSALADDQVEVVINLALPTSDNAIPNEGELVTRLGMAYFHIPVQFGEPNPRDYYLFESILQSVEGKRTFIHCAANMRVSAFMYLYHRRNGLCSPDKAKELMNRV
ncbi:MAG: coaBC 2, partial [Verrucomicrobiales bacterium]|nr:coaBC 2 [Verrucomicrobiales bacterium]